LPAVVTGAEAGADVLNLEAAPRMRAGKHAALAVDEQR